MTTEWVIVGLVPVVPLKTFRVLPDPRHDVRAVFANVTAYQAVERLPMDGAQVARTYLFVLATCLWGLSTFWIIGDPVKVSTPFEHSVLKIFALMLALPLPWALLLVLRRFSRKRHHPS